MARQDIVWVIDDDRSIRWVLEKALGQADMNVRSFDSANEIDELLERQRPDVVISDIRMPGVSGLEVLKIVHAKAPEIPVIIITAHTDLESAVASYRGGAFEYLPKPFDVDEAVSLVRRAVEHRRRQRPEPASIQEETLVEPAARSLESAAAYQYIRAYQGEILGDFGSPQSVGALSTIIPDSTHAQSSGLATATDAGARRFARENG